MKTVKFLFVLLFILSTPLQLFGRVTESAENLLHVIHRVNRHWQENNSPQVRSFWDNAAYHTGNMEVYELTGNTAYLKYSTDWAECTLRRLAMLFPDLCRFVWHPGG